MMRTNLSRIAILILPCLLMACATTVEPTRKEMSRTQPADLANPIPDTALSEPVPTGPFGQWAAIIVAGDNLAGNGKPTETFDNARKDLAVALVGAGFSPQHIRQFTVKPKSDDATEPKTASTEAVRSVMHRLLGSAGEGCLYYVTTHGDKSGIKFGRKMLKPEALTSLVDLTCGVRPTIVVISACHSGVFVPALAAPNRMVFTAAHADRSSFGCGESSQYPYFDQCTIESMPSAKDFQQLASSVKACVARMESTQGFQPSQPQLFIGEAIAPILADKPFTN